MESISEHSSKKTDCKFIIKDDQGTHIFPCHKVIFGFASEVFERMFFGGHFKEALTGEVELVDIKPDVFEKFKTYVYTYEKENLKKYRTETLRDLVMVGTKYVMKSLVNDCVATLCYRKNKWNITDILKLLECGYLIDNANLITTVTYILKYTFIEPDSLTNDGIYDLSPKVFYQYMSLITGRLAEPIRFSLIESYLKAFGVNDVVIDFDKLDHHCRIMNTEPLAYDEPHVGKNLISFFKKYVQSIMSLIEFKEFEPTEFYEGPGKSKYFTLRMKYELLYEIAEKQTIKQRKVSVSTQQQ